MVWSTSTYPAPLNRDEAGILVGQTMGLVAATASLFALGTSLGREMAYGWGWAFFIAALALLFDMSFAARVPSISRAGCCSASAS
jgi:hypothetical protein